MLKDIGITAQLLLSFLHLDINIYWKLTNINHMCWIVEMIFIFIISELFIPKRDICYFFF